MSSGVDVSCLLTPARAFSLVGGLLLAAADQAGEGRQTTSVGTTLAIGAGLGMTVGILVGGGAGIAIGAGIGAGIGVVVGASWDAAHRSGWGGRAASRR